MITGELRSRIDQLWLQFWTGGIANPLSVIEQITFLMFIRLLDINESRNENRARRSGKSFKRIFSEDEEGQNLRWSIFKNLSAEKMLPFVRDKVFEHIRDMAKESESKLGKYMADAQLQIQKESLLVQAINMIDSLPLTQGDTKGDLYEYLLSKLTTSGINGQFRTPRHIIQLMVALLDPKPQETIGDPACGTAGFLIECMKYLVEKNTSLEGIHEEKVNGDIEKIFSGDLLSPEQWNHIQQNMFHGFDFDNTMLRIASMNLMLHGVQNPNIHYQDSLASSFTERFSQQSKNFFDLILANPPFKGSLDYDDVESGLLSKVKTKKTELLFLVLILQMLKTGGRSATIVPDGVLFGSSKAHQELRRILLDENQLEAVISLPSGVFKPYAGVSTAIIVFTKGGNTRNVFFYDVKADGYSLDDKRDKVEQNDLPDVLEKWRGRNVEQMQDRTQKWFFVEAEEIRANKWDLAINRYKEEEYEEVKYEEPREIIANLKHLEYDILAELSQLEGLL